VKPIVQFVLFRPMQRADLEPTTALYTKHQLVASRAVACPTPGRAAKAVEDPAATRPEVTP